MNNYSFDRQGFLTYMKKLPSGSKVIWRYLAIKFHVKNKSGQFPKNAGQVLMTSLRKMVLTPASLTSVRE